MKTIKARQTPVSELTLQDMVILHVAQVHRLFSRPFVVSHHNTRERCWLFVRRCGTADERDTAIGVFRNGPTIEWSDDG
jgi:hypothetical protein